MFEHTGFEHTGKLIDGLGSRIGNWDWIGIGHEASLLHGIWTGVIILLILAGIGFATIQWFKVCGSHPVATIVWTFIVFTAVLGGIEVWGNAGARYEARQELRLRNSSEVPERLGITYNSRASNPWGGKQTYLSGKDNWIPIYRNTSPNPVIVQIEAGGSICFYPGSKKHRLHSWVFSPDGLINDPSGYIPRSDPGALARYPAPNLPDTRCALVGRINGELPFFIGTGPVSTRVESGQVVYATSNDRQRKDNSGPKSHLKWLISVK